MPVYGFFWTEWLHGCIYVMLVLDPNYVTSQYEGCHSKKITQAIAE